VVGCFYPTRRAFCNHEEKDFATTRREHSQPRGGKKIGDFGDFASGWDSESGVC